MQSQEFGYCKGQYYYGHSRYRWRTWFRFNSRNWVCERQPFTVTRHDGSVVRFTAVPKDYDPTDREKVYSYLQEHRGDIATGILFVDETVADLHEMNQTARMALARMPYEKLCPGAAALDALQEDFR